MLQLKHQFLAVVSLILMVLSHADADKPTCVDLGNYYHPYECRKNCPIVGPHYGHENEQFVDMTVDKGTCAEGLKCCQLHYYRSGVSTGRLYTNTGTSWPTKEFQWCTFFNTCEYP